MKTKYKHPILGRIFFYIFSALGGTFTIGTGVGVWEIAHIASPAKVVSPQQWFEKHKTAFISCAVCGGSLLPTGIGSYKLGKGRRCNSHQ